MKFRAARVPVSGTGLDSYHELERYASHFFIP